MKGRYKKNRLPQFYESGCLCTIPHDEPPPDLTGPFERCEGCPYPGHGFVCWSQEGETCLRTVMARIMERDRLVSFTG